MTACLLSAFAERRRAAGVATPQIQPIAAAPARLPVRPKLTPATIEAEEPVLLERFRAGDRLAGDTLVRAYDSVLMSVAKRYARHCTLLEERDLLQVARMAFLNAARDHDPTRGPLKAYATALARFEVMNTIAAEDGTIVIPAKQIHAIRRALKAGGLPAKLDAINRLRTLASMEEPLYEDGDDALRDRLAAPGCSPEDALIALEEINGRATRPVWRADGSGCDREEAAYMPDLWRRGS